MGNTAVKQHMETAEKTGVLQLSKSGLKEFPDDIQKLNKNLRTLDFSDNKIRSIPPSIGGFNNLKSMNLASNRLESLPTEIGMLKKLETLSLENNCLSGLPDSFQNLVNLIQLNLSHNQFINFPAPLCQLKKLDAVDMSRNRITHLPENISTCQSIEINLNQNQISRLPESIADCPRLKVLRLEENCLEISAFTPKVMRESQISLFAVEGNVFDMKTWNNIEGYDQYMERYTATKKKFN